MEKKISLGDMIDDFCPRCRLILNHGVVAMVEQEVKKTRCLTCQNEHPYRHAKDTRRKTNSKSSLFDQVLSGMPGHQKTGSKKKK
jgi:RNase P subunit RPR2